MLKPLVIVSAAIIVVGCGDVTPDVEVTSTLTSPDSSYIATLYLTSGGGAVGWCYQYIAVRRADAPFIPEAGIVFSATCSADISLSWRDARDLHVTYPRGTRRVTRQENAHQGAVQISYEER